MLIAEELLTAASAELGISTAELADTKPFALHWLRTLLRDTLIYENFWRADNGRPALGDPPAIKAWGDEVTYEAPHLRTALEYGLAAKLFSVEDENESKGQEYREMYVAACGEMPALQGQIVDVYGGDGEG